MRVPQVLELQGQALTRWVPTWAQAFTDTRYGGFHERLDNARLPLPVGYKRLLTQCRQLFVYSQARLLTGDAVYDAPLRAGFVFLRRFYYRPRLGAWIFSVAPDGAPHDTTLDLYGHAFVVLALSYYIRATEDASARPLCDATLRAIDTHFRADVGFWEQLSDSGAPTVGVRRQNSHMHLLEACLLAHTLIGAPRAKRMAQEVCALFLRHFFDATSSTLVEFFTPNWQPHPTRGAVVEPGHHYEWVWLLHRCREAQLWDDDPDRDAITARLQSAAMALACWAAAHAWDTHHGGIFDQLSRSDGQVLQPTKRIWHITEALKVAGIVSDLHSAPIAGLLRSYVTPAGLWVETKTQTLAPATQHMPGTTPYHLLMGVTEAARLADAPVYASSSPKATCDLPPPAQTELRPDTGRAQNQR